MKLCQMDGVPEGEARGFVVAGFARKVVVVRRGGRIFAYLDSCPHYEGGTPMAWKTDRYLNGEGTHLACHSHGALFEIETGECVLGPCLGQRLKKVPVRITPLGDIEVVREPAREELG
ncbi:Rieske (2Fe-2S) protein [Mesorhizobium sp. L-8-3]|uniref:Rieske (2Fe-2S) protein n=1 Tax=Mesorhizobium sp. L-8-3 TaxID=2744522 RepID=UPI001936F2E9|nr:Rieske 2Fe-2S domain-containing protein [Mesorhizobium sp. L-8-3]BCH21502.1 (2Fe-2S)-binding protein [Mesorhizobium sp. L-8-3]